VLDNVDETETIKCWQHDKEASYSQRISLIHKRTPRTSNLTGGFEVCCKVRKTFFWNVTSHICWQNQMMINTAMNAILFTNW